MSRAWLRLTAGVFMAFVVSSAFAQGKGEVPDSLFDKAVELSLIHISEPTRP